MSMPTTAAAPRTKLRFGAAEVGLDAAIPAHLAPVVREVSSLGELRPNWNSYGAPAIDPAIARAAVEFMVEHLSPNIPLPAVVPTSRGGIQLEWHCNDADLEVDFQTPVRLHVSLEDLKADREESSERDGDFEPLRRMLLTCDVASV